MEAFHSILYAHAGAGAARAHGEPRCLHDLNLDQAIAEIAARRPWYDVAPLFYARAATVDDVIYRREIMAALEDDDLRSAFEEFGRNMRRVREFLKTAADMDSVYQAQRWQIEAVRAYADAVVSLRAALHDHAVHARGLLGLRVYLDDYCSSARFVALQNSCTKLLQALADVRYQLLIKDNTVTVSVSSGAADFGAAITQLFAKFNQGVGAARDANAPDGSGRMNHVEYAILEHVAKLHPGLFAEIAAFCAEHETFLDAVLLRCEHEVQFYLGYLEYVAPLRRAGLPLCYPRVTAENNGTALRGAYDLVLATKCVQEERAIVCNDVTLSPGERIVVVTGPNQGGKTTFARMLGQIHYFAGLGCPVPAREATVTLRDEVFTHFQRRKRVRAESGALHDELVRMREILNAAGADSLIIINEMFASTSVEDSLHLSRKILAQVRERGALCACVTFLDELAADGADTVSMAATVETGPQARRTYKVLRQPPSGRAYALALAEAHGLTYEQILKRLRP